jgi:hypothetical protein
VGNKLIQPFQKLLYRFPPNINRITYDPAIKLLGFYLKELVFDLKNICTSIFIVELFKIPKILKQPKYPSMDECIK